MSRSSSTTSKVASIRDSRLRKVCAVVLILSLHRIFVYRRAPETSVTPPSYRRCPDGEYADCASLRFYTPSPNPRTQKDIISLMKADKAFPVVGIGASAGGFEAFSQFLKYLPEDTGMAFVFIQHLDPAHKSMLAELLSKAT